MEEYFKNRKDRWLVDNVFYHYDGFIIRENITPGNIENNGGVAKADEETKTCALCVALNETVFFSDNRPTYYHKNCKCTLRPYNLEKVKLNFPKQKITEYLLASPAKYPLMKAMGYDKEDADYLQEVIGENAQRKFLKGEYTLGELDENGQRVNIVIELQGKGTKSNRIYRFQTGWMAYPGGKLKNNTPFAKWAD